MPCSMLRRARLADLRARGVEQPPDLVVAEHLVADLGQRRELLRARLAAGRRHHRALVRPSAARRGAAEVADLAEARAQVLDRAHSRSLDSRPGRDFGVESAVPER